MDLPDKTSAVPKARERKAPVIPKGVAKSVSRPIGRRFLDYVFAESPKTILATVVTNTLVPRMKAAGEEALGSFVHGMLWDGAAKPSGLITQGTVIRGGGVVLNPNGGIDYNAVSNNPALMSPAVSRTGAYEDLVLPTQQFAEMLYASLLEDINQYRVTTVADLYEAASLTPPEHHANYGWYSLDGARIVKEREGFKLMLPKPVRV